MTEEPDYITITPAVKHAQFNVCHMKWVRSNDDGYVTYRVSAALPKAAAEALARSWAAALQVEIR
jgi:hypothetical protein